nr:alpha-scruin-like [Parasteatoda tepidariorum]
MSDVQKNRHKFGRIVLEKSASDADTKIFNKDYYETHEIETAAVKIQAGTRGYLTRKKLQEQLDEANYAATVIQSGVRGYMSRKSYQRSQGKEMLRSPKKVKNTQDDQSKPEEKILFTSEKTENLTTYPSFLLMGACDPSKFEYGVNSIISYDIEGSVWETIALSPISLLNAGMVSTEKTLFIIGGCSIRDVTEDGRMVPIKNGYSYDFEDEKWSVLSPMNEPRSLHGVVNFQGRIFVIGGISDLKKFRILSSIEMLDEASGQWMEFEPSLPQPLFGMGVAVYDGLLWIAGGITQIGDEESYTDAVWCYDHKLKRWCNRPFLPQPIAFGTLLASGHNLFSIGGTIRSRSGNDIISINNIYSFKNGAWVENTPIPKNLHSVVAGIYEKNIYIFGALSLETRCPLEQPIYFDGREQTWKRVVSLPESSSGYIIASAARHDFIKKRKEEN